MPKSKKQIIKSNIIKSNIIKPMNNQLIEDIDDITEEKNQLKSINTINKNNIEIENDIDDEDDVDEDDNYDDDNYIKIISAEFELNEIDYPKLFELNKNSIPHILKKIITYGYNHYYPDIDDREIIDNPINNPINNKLEVLDTLINKLTGISNNSKKIGIFGENYIHDLITKNFIGMSYQKTGETDHSGDGLITLNNGAEILVEIKNYTTVVNDDEINKFSFDMKHNKRKLGIFISLTSKVNKMKIIDLKSFVHNNETYYQFFISNLSEDLHRLEVGILLLQLLSEVTNTNKEHELNDIVKEKINTLIDQINENEQLRGMFLTTEKEIRNSLNGFYQKLRDNHMDMENKIKNIFSCLKDNNITNIETVVTNELLEKYKTSKIYSILKKTIDYLNTNNIEYSNNDKEIIINKYGVIKIQKEKIVLQTKSKLSIPINIDTWDSFEKEFN